MPTRPAMSEPARTTTLINPALEFSQGDDAEG